MIALAVAQKAEGTTFLIATRSYGNSDRWRRLAGHKHGRRPLLRRVDVPAEFVSWDAVFAVEPALTHVRARVLPA